jgi:hypothetical protein
MPVPKLPLSEHENGAIVELLKGAWLVLRLHPDAAKPFRRTIARLGMPVPLAPMLARREQRDLSDGEIDGALEQLDGAAAIYVNRSPYKATVRNAERKLVARLLAMKGRVPSEPRTAAAGELVAHNDRISRQCRRPGCVLPFKPRKIF